MRVMLLLLAGQTVSPAADRSAIAAFDLATTIATPPSLLVLTPRCGATADETDVVVCARGDRYRLPLPTERATGGTARDLPGGTAALAPSGACGIFAGEHRCRNADKADFGYSRGRDPLTLAARLAGKLIHPDDD